MSRHLRPLEDPPLGDALPKLEELVLFQNMLQKSNGSYEWKLLQWSLKELVEKFGDKKLPFRIGDHNKRTCALQHEHWSISPPAKSEKLTLQEFIKLQETLPSNKWYYCDYKYINNLFSDNKEIVESFNWLKFGIDKEVGENGMNSIIWIGSKGAHTDCHWDTYGYNLVAQIHGRKQWLLYPPSDSLIPVRLPYEESTVYSRFNIYCLSEEEEEYLQNITERPKLITLEPGDVLFVPNGWWHYVESLDEINVSVNIRFKLKTDSKARVEEALVNLIIAKLGDEQFSNEEIHYTEKVECAVIQCKKEEEKEEQKKKAESGPKLSTKRLFKTQTAKELAEEYPYYVKLLPDAENHKLKEFFKERRERDKKKSPSDKKIASGDYIPSPQFDTFLSYRIYYHCIMSSKGY